MPTRPSLPHARPDASAADADLVARFGDHLALERRLSSNTVQAYRSDLEHVCAFLERQGLTLATADYPTLRRFLAHEMTLGYARSSVARRVAAIRTFYRW